MRTTKRGRADASWEINRGATSFGGKSNTPSSRARSRGRRKRDGENNNIDGKRRDRGGADVGAREIGMQISTRVREGARVKGAMSHRSLKSAGRLRAHVAAASSSGRKPRAASFPGRDIARRPPPASGRPTKSKPGLAN